MGDESEGRRWPPAAAHSKQGTAAQTEAFVLRAAADKSLPGSVYSLLHGVPNANAQGERGES